jgi:zinc and cadmium transporter
MTTFLWILGSGLVMSALALSGSLTLFLSEGTLKRILLPLVAFSAGSMLGGAFFHMLPEAVAHMGNDLAPWAWCAGGFAAFFCLEQFLQWHHCHGSPSEHHHPPLTWLVLTADAVHNFVAGLAVAGAFLIDLRLGMVAWVAAAAHEVPQELGDFGVLVHWGWDKKRALLFNLLSALSFPLGGVIAYALSSMISVDFLVPFAAGNFIYIASADLVPELHRHPRFRTNLVHLGALLAGLGLLAMLRVVLPHG